MKDNSARFRNQSQLSNTNSNSSVMTEKDKEEHWWQTDRSSVLLLLFLYLLQGIPLGLAGSIPMLLASKGIDYHQQALFSFVFWPFSVKLLWAPIVDGAYLQKFGRRKSWMVPSQYCISLVMMILSYCLGPMLESSETGSSMFQLTACFFILNICAATQDIAVDGWALTMLSQKNVGLASTCNTVGQTAGYFLGYVVFLALESASFCNKYLRTIPSENGVVDLPDFMFFWSIVFFVSTTLVMIFKEEKPASCEESEGVLSTYKQLFQILSLPSVMQWVIILLTCKMSAASESLVGLKLIELGVSKESLAIMAVPLTPLQIGLPLVIAKYTAGPRPLDFFLRGLQCRLLFCLVFAVVVHATPSFKDENNEYSYAYFVLLLTVYCFHQVAAYSIFVALMAFNAKISDPTIGGTYMTLLNTVANLGGNWPSTLAMWLVPYMTWKSCKEGASDGISCSYDGNDQCLADGGTCEIDIDGFYAISVICFIIGAFWLLWNKEKIRNLQMVDADKWRCTKSVAATL